MILKWTDFTIAITGAVVGIGFYTFLAFASNKWMMFVGEFNVCEVAVWLVLRETVNFVSQESRETYKYYWEKQN